jgi:hypothetical protein
MSREMSAAADMFNDARAKRGLERLLGHCQLIGHMTADTQRVEARKRLEFELGPELTRRLVSRLSSAPA